MSDFGQHLIEHDCSKMSETEFPQQFEIGDAAKAKTEGGARRAARATRASRREQLGTLVDPFTQ